MKPTLTPKITAVLALLVLLPTISACVIEPAGGRVEVERPYHPYRGGYWR